MELQLSEADSVSIGYVSDPYALLRAIDEAMPKDAILYVEGNSIVREIKDFLTSRQAGTPREIERGTTWPKPKTFHMLLEGTNLAELRALAEHHAAPEICDHLVVYRGDQVLLAAYDAGDNVVDVTKSLSQETVECLCEALGLALPGNGSILAVDKPAGALNVRGRAGARLKPRAGSIPAASIFRRKSVLLRRTL